VGGRALFLLAVATGKTTGYADVTPLKFAFLIGSMAIGGGIGDILYTVSLSRIGVSRAYPIASIHPAITLILAVLFLHEAVNWMVIAGLILVIGGVFFISNTTKTGDASAAASERTVAAPAQTSGIALALITALCWAVATTMVSPGMKGLDPITVASFRVPALSLMLWGVVLARKSWPQLRQLARKEWVVLVVGGFIGWGLGSVLFLWTIALIGSMRAAIITAASPLFALPLSVIFLREKVNRTVLAGTALTVAGVILVS